MTVRFFDGDREVKDLKVQVNNTSLTGPLDLSRAPGVFVVRVVDDRYQRTSETFVVEDGPLKVRVPLSQRRTARPSRDRKSDPDPPSSQKPRRLYHPDSSERSHRLYVPDSN